MFVFLCLIFASLLLLSLHLLGYLESRKGRLLRKFPTPPSIPLIGVALQLNITNELFFRIIRYAMVRYRGISVGWILNMPYLTVADADLAQKILSSNTNIDKSTEYDLLNPWLGTGLLTSKGDKWFRHRKLLTPAFHFGILERFMSIFNEETRELVQILRKEHGESPKSFNIFPYVTRCALDIICEAAMGIKVNAQHERDSDYVRAIYRISELVQYRMMRPLLQPTLTWNLFGHGKEEKALLTILHGFTENVIAQRKKEMSGQASSGLEDSAEESQKGEEGEAEPVTSGRKKKKKKKERAAFLDLLLTAQMEGQRSGDVNSQLTDEEIREETDTFMFEGHDTTAASMNWTIFLLGSHPEYQRLVHQELDSIFGDDRERKITVEDLVQMKYLECCIKESLRLYPSVPFIARAITTDIELDDETVIPTGTTAFIIPYQVHRDASVYPEPEFFLPDRFFPENLRGRSPFSYIPFSAGPRNCIGQKFALMEEKVLLANIFRNFRVQAAERREDLVILAELIARPKNGLQVKLFPR